MTTYSSHPWDSRYGREDFFYGSEPNDFLRTHGHRIAPHGEVLCLAEGEGRNAVFLASLGHSATGVDGSPVGLQKAHRLASERGTTIDTVVADLGAYDLGTARWDAVVSIWCHLSAAMRPSMHARVRRALRHGGLVLFEHYHPRQLDYRTGGPPDAAMMLTLDELRSDFDGFELLHAWEGERNIIEGTGHKGPSFVTQFVARKRG
jgi:SAM-dependent methyltransferase